MFCNKCGAQLPDGAKFCNKCGASFADRAIGESGDAVTSSADTVSPAAAQPKRSKRRKAPIVIGVAAVLLVAAVVATGILTDWFGHTSKGVWRLTKVYKDNRLAEQYEYDEHGREVSGKYDISKDGKSFTTRTYSYEANVGNRSACKIVYEAHADGKVTDTDVGRLSYELGPNGRILSRKDWYSTWSDFSADDLSEDRARTYSCSYSLFDTLVALDYVDSQNGSRTWKCKRSEYDSNGWLIRDVINSDDAGEVKYSVSCSLFGKPEAVVIGDKRYEVEGDDNGNIICATIDGTTYRYEYQFFADPKIWDERRPFVYTSW